MNCSLTKTYGLISGAIAMLGVAIASASIFFNIPGLVVAIGLAATVSFVMIPQIRASIRDYASCRGPETSCSVGRTIDVLGQAASVLSIIAWTAALALQISALAFIASFFLSWLGVTLAAAGEALKYGGIVGAGACAAILVGLLTEVRNYQACRERESPVRPGPIG